MKQLVLAFLIVVVALGLMMGLDLPGYFNSTHIFIFYLGIVIVAISTIIAARK